MQPYSFTNRTQAQKHAEKVDGKVINPGRVFYVKVKEEVEIDEVGQSRPRAGGPISIQRNIKKHIELMNKYIKQGMSKDEASKNA